MHARAAPTSSMVVTPHSIPQFFIPHAANTAAAASEQRSEKPREHPNPERTRRAVALSSSPASSTHDLQGTRLTDKAEATGHDWASSASALAPLDVTEATSPLPHLPRITTPYGFQTLAHSPNTRRKESLFFEPGGGGGGSSPGAADAALLLRSMTLLRAGGSRARSRSASPRPSASRRAPGTGGAAGGGGGGGHLREEPASLSARAMSCEVLHGDAASCGVHFDALAGSAGGVPLITVSRPDGGPQVAGPEAKKGAGKLHLRGIIRRHIPGLRLSRSPGSFKASPSATGNA
uniref:C2 calcium-dependent domain-containing protein 4C-like n=1 Tax=Petromyzon marinus TaxID=7757 RepID=A0AAJ7X8A3_PETMA|nr:C2 calcium-dependent domain-containing protein 4C-like [Petromyzon marinus]